ncbi:fructosamine kinase family protein [Paraflavisolibacter sp. H34]|uniref:fructosamine kinase family protein n=1 Tax=Huijunlia imazamoxiresistens TaxID=3127457 RepID=UPI0030196EA8
MIPAGVRDHLSRLLQQPLDSRQFIPINGGSINQAFQLRLPEGRKLFCKLNTATHFPLLFQKEKAGLQLLGRQQVVSVPAVLDAAVTGAHQVLLLEWVEEGPRTPAFWRQFGRQLAQLHAVSADAFGLEEDNFMGSVPQCNQQEADWCTFFTRHRLWPLARDCYRLGLLQQGHLDQLDRLYGRLQDIFEPEKPSLLHGDLWSGNFICNHRSEPVLIDPAVSFGHRSADLAMTTLFGGFGPEFYDAYQHYFPLPRNYRDQWAVCNLYPLLIHLLLFGSSYRAQIEQTLDAFS